MNKNYRILIIFVFALIIALMIDFYRAANFNPDKVKQNNNQNQIEQKHEETQVQNEVKEPEKVEETKNAEEANYDEKIEIKLNPLMEFSGMKAAEVISLRKKAVKNSKIFSDIDYKPTPIIFQMEDGYPWISASQITCYGADDNPDIGKGPSRESMPILNPELMYNVQILNYKFSKYNMPCSPNDYLVHKKAVYDKKTNTITAYINAKYLYKKLYGKMGVHLSDSNARDFGYQYAFAISTSNIVFNNNENLSNKVIQTLGFFHKGYACGLPNGCNNYSPYEPAYVFKITNLPATINIKLWKNYPNSVNDKSDFNYIMIFE